MASISIFCRNRTTGASSTSEVASLDSCSAVVSSVTSKSKSPAARDSIVSLALAAIGGHQLGQLVVLDDHPFGRKLRRELDALDRFLVGWVGAADEQAIAALAEHHDLVLVDQLVVDHVARQSLGVDGSEVENRQCQRVRQRVRQVGRRHRTGGDERRDEADLALGSGLDQRLGRLRIELAGVHKHPGDAGQRGMGGFGQRIHVEGRQLTMQKEANGIIADHPGTVNRRARPCRQQFTPPSACARTVLQTGSTQASLVGVRGFEPPASTSRT